MKLNKSNFVGFNHKINQFYRDKNNRPVVYFLLAGSVFGLLLVFMLPPMQGPDEPNQFLRAYQISSGHLVSGYVNAYGERGIASVPSKSIGGSEPVGVVKLTRLGYADLIPGDTALKFNYNDLKAIGDIKNSNKYIAVSFPNTAVYSPVAYIPSVVGIEIGKIFNVSPLVLMYMARLGDLFFGLIMIGFAIYLMPLAKYIFTVLALLPMTLAQLSIITADTATYAFAFLEVALIFRLAYQKRDTSKLQIALLLVVAALLSLTKPALFPISFISLALLVNKNIPKIKARVIAILTIAISILCTISWNSYINKMALFGYKISYPNSNYNLQLKFIEHHPLKYVGVLLNSLFTYHFDGVPVSFIGNLGWLDTPLPLIGIIAGFVIIIFVIYFSSQNETIKLPRWLGYVCLLSGLFIIFVTLSAQYLYSVTPGNSFITGMQGRYFLPAVLVATLYFLTGKNPPSKSRLFDAGKYCLNASLLLLILMIFTVALRFYNLSSIISHRL